MQIQVLFHMMHSENINKANIFVLVVICQWSLLTIYRYHRLIVGIRTFVSTILDLPQHIQRPPLLWRRLLLQKLWLFEQPWSLLTLVELPPLCIYSDSLTLIKLVKKKGRNLEIARILNDIYLLCHKFIAIQFKHIPRADNNRADSIAKQALGLMYEP